MQTLPPPCGRSWKTKLFLEKHNTLNTTFGVICCLELRNVITIHLIYYQQRSNWLFGHY